MEIYFLKGDIIAAFAYWIVMQRKVIPSNMSTILLDLGNWLQANELKKPKVSIPDFILYETNKNELSSYLDRIVEEVQSIKELNERSAENLNDFVDLGALSRNVLIMMKKNQQESNAFLTSSSGSKA